MVRARAAFDAWLRSISSVTMAGSVASGGGASRGGPAGASSGGAGRRSPRSTMVCSASPISGSPLPMTSRRAARLPGEARPRATSTNSLPPASYIRGIAVSWNTESPSGFMGSVIIC